MLPLATPPHVGHSLTFDAAFAWLVRVSGWLLGLWAALTGVLKGAELLALIAAFVGYEVLSRAGAKRLEDLEKRREP
jgi:hypothetical protein